MSSFKCKASKCEDTCCRGWEIDVDEVAADYYSSLMGEDGEFVRAGLHIKEHEGGKACGYMLCHEGKRCGFLREDNLCELILRLGEDALCDVCREHPRFYSGEDGLTEAGLGLCCEEAARLWLDLPIEFDTIDDGEPCDELTKAELEAQFSAIRHVMSESDTLGERLAQLLSDNGEDCYIQLRELFTSLEMMDKTLGEKYSIDSPTSSDPRFVKLAVYFLYRYWFELGGEMAIKFAAVSLVMIASLGCDVQNNAKLYSGEVEYDPDNVDRICDVIQSLELTALVRRIFNCR